MADDPSSPFAQATADAIEAVERARPLAKRLVDELGELTPSPDQILGDDDKRRLDALRRRQVQQPRSRQGAWPSAPRAPTACPATPPSAIEDRVSDAAGPMTQAEQRMAGRDPSGARDAARSAADALNKAKSGGPEARRARPRPRATAPSARSRCASRAPISTSRPRRSARSCSRA
jgi:hypothetical protein